MKNKNYIALVIVLIVLVAAIFIIKKEALRPKQNLPAYNEQINSVNGEANWATYSSSIYKITFKYPNSWGRVANDLGVMTDGKDITVSSFLGSGMNIEGVVNFEINQKSQPYGVNPIIKNLKIDGQEAQLIESDKNSSLVVATLIIKYPQPINIQINNSSQKYEYIIVNFNNVDLNLVEQIVSSVHFFGRT